MTSNWSFYGYEMDNVVEFGFVGFLRVPSFAFFLLFFLFFPSLILPLGQAWQPLVLMCTGRLEKCGALGFQHKAVG